MLHFLRNDRKSAATFGLFEDTDAGEMKGEGYWIQKYLGKRFKVDAMEDNEGADNQSDDDDVKSI